MAKSLQAIPCAVLLTVLGFAIPAAVQAQNSEQESFQTLQNDQFARALAKVDAACGSTLQASIDFATFTDRDYSNFGFTRTCEQAVAPLLTQCGSNPDMPGIVQSTLKGIRCAIAETAGVDITEDGILVLAVEPRNPASLTTFSDFFDTILPQLARDPAAEAAAADSDRTAMESSPAFQQASADWRSLAQWHEQMIAVPERLPAYDPIVDHPRLAFEGANLAALEQAARALGPERQVIDDGVRSIARRYGVGEADLEGNPFAGADRIEEGIFSGMGFVWDPGCVQRGDCPQEPSLGDLPKPARLLVEMERARSRSADLMAGIEGIVIDKVSTAIDIVIEGGNVGDGNRQRLQDALAAIDGYLGLAQIVGNEGPAVQQLQADYARVAEAYGGFDAMVTEQARARRWPDAFTGVEPARDLAQAALDHLNQAMEEEILVVQVSGTWFVAARNLLGDPLQWALPVQIAYLSDNDWERGVARTAEFHMLAAEGQPPVQAPPFIGRAAVVGLFNGAFIALENLPGGGKSLVVLP